LPRQKKRQPKWKHAPEQRRKGQRLRPEETLEILRLLKTTGMTQKEIGELYNVTGAKICQISQRNFKDPKYADNLLKQWKRELDSIEAVESVIHVKEAQKEIVKSAKSITKLASSLCSEALTVTKVKSIMKLHGMTWKKMKSVSIDINSLDMKLLRRKFAYMMIEAFVSNKRVINIDESCLSTSDFQSMSWTCNNKIPNFNTNKLTGRMTLVAAVDNNGEAWISLSQGNSTTGSTIAILCDLVEELNSEDDNWRENTVIVFDNAPWHKSKRMLEAIECMAVPVLFASPYSPALCAIENYFALLKSDELEIEFDKGEHR
jgi:predicted XRE-type DNA-binding protein